MTTMTATTYGAEFSKDTAYGTTIAFLGDGYTTDEADLFCAALVDAFRDAVNELLPDGVTWQPQTSEFLHPVGAQIPTAEEMTELFNSAWDVVESNLAEIEEKTLAHMWELRLAAEADREGKVAAFDVELAAAYRALHIKAAVELAGRNKIAALMGIAGPTVSAITASVPPQRDVTDFLLVEVTEDLVGDPDMREISYEHKDLGKLSLRVDGRHLRFVPDIDCAARWVQMRSGIDRGKLRVVAVADDVRTYAERAWTFAAAPQPTMAM